MFDLQWFIMILLAVSVRWKVLEIVSKNLFLIPYYLHITYYG